MNRAEMETFVRNVFAQGYQRAELIAGLKADRDAAAIQYLCKLRTVLMQKFKKTDDVHCICFDDLSVNAFAADLLFQSLNVNHKYIDIEG